MVPGAPSSARQRLKCCINTEQLPGSYVFLKDFYREENMIFLYKNKYYEIESKLTHIKFSDENAKVQKYLISLRSEYQAPESLSKLFSATGDIWRVGWGAGGAEFQALIRKSALTLRSARLGLCHLIAV